MAATARQTRTVFASRAASASIIHHPDRLPSAHSPGRRTQARRHRCRSAQPLECIPQGDLGRSARSAAGGLKKILERDGGDALAGFGSAKCSNEEAYLFQKLIRQGFGTNNVRPLHASLPRLVRRRPHGRPQLRRRDGPVHGGQGRRGHHHHRRASFGEPPGRRHFHP